MAKGVGWMMAIGAASMSSAKDWYAAVLAAAGLDPRIDPYTGSIVDVEWNGVIFCYSSPFVWDSEAKVERGRNGRAQILLKARPSNDVSLSLQIVDGEGNLIASTEPGRRSGWLWSFEQLIGVTMRPEEFPPIPDELKVVWPDWWPHRALEEYDGKHAVELENALASIKEEARSLGILIGRSNLYIDHNNPWSKPVCETCGDNLCPGSENRWGEEKPCKNADKHLETLLSYWQYLIERRREFFAAQEKKAEKARADQALLDAALSGPGFIYERIGKASIPAGATVISIQSMGDKHNPIMLIAAPRLTIDQLRAVVKAAGDGSEVVMEGRFPVIVTANPAKWIGKGGSIAKSLAAALGQKFLKVQEKK